MLKLETSERVRDGERDLRPLEDSYLSYSQVFPRQGRWPHLGMFHLRGLAISGLDLLPLVYEQMPQLKRLRLKRIDLLERDGKVSLKLYEIAIGNYSVLKDNFAITAVNGGLVRQIKKKKKILRLAVSWIMSPMVVVIAICQLAIMIGTPKFTWL